MKKRSRRAKGMLRWGNRLKTAMVKMKECRLGNRQGRLMMFDSKASSNTINAVQSLLRASNDFRGISVFSGQIGCTSHLTFISSLLHNVFVLADGIHIHMKTRNCLSTQVCT